MSEPTVQALVELVREGHLAWGEAALELRAELGWTNAELYATGAAARLQAVDQEYQSKVRRLTLARHLSGN